MLRLPPRFAAVILRFAPLMRQRGWRHAEVLLLGAILAPGARTVAGALRIAGLGRERRFADRRRAPDRAAWSGLAATRALFGLLLDAFAPEGPAVLGLDDTIERRRGRRIAAKGVHRDPVRSSKGHFVKASRLRWLGLMLLAPVPWAGRTWALPFLTALGPSERFCRERGLRPKTLADRARQLVLLARRWLPPGRAMVVVADSAFAALDLLAALARRGGIACVARLRLDAALWEPPPPRRSGTVGRPRIKGARLPRRSAVLADPAAPCRRVVVPGWYGGDERMLDLCSGVAVWYRPGAPAVPIRWVLLRDPGRRFEPQALLCTDTAQPPERAVRWFAQRWQVEVAFREARDHLGVETQRQWSDKAIARTAP